jgi:hypothetical protein
LLDRFRLVEHMEHEMRNVSATAATPATIRMASAVVSRMSRSVTGTMASFPSSHVTGT